MAPRPPNMTGREIANIGSLSGAASVGPVLPLALRITA